MTSYADRSRVLTYQSCPRRRWLEYEVPTGNEVSGVRPAKLDMNLLTGSCFHTGVECLLHGDKVDYAVEGALVEYWPLVKSQGLILEDSEDAGYVAYEQAALIEALIRGYAAFVLPQLLERFQVVEVEREEMATFSIPGFDLKFGARVDALLMEKESLDLYALSLKTAKEWGKKDDESARHDMQGLSETRVLEQRLGRWQQCLDEAQAQGLQDYLKLSPYEGIPQWFYDRWATGAPPTLMGVKMEYALKGRRAEEPKGSGRWCYSNPLIRPWKKADDLGGESYAFRYEFKDPMGGNHRLGKGWNRVNIWEDMGVKEWIERLATQEIQGFSPGVGIASQFVLPIEYYRNEEDMERWERQVVHQEHRVADGVDSLRLIMNRDALNYSSQEVENALDEHFPMHTKACDWPTKCPYQVVCFGPKAYLMDPMSSGLFQIREPNHCTELEGA